jgi:hypothetical protein
MWPKMFLFAEDKESVDEKLANIMEKQKLTLAKKPEVSAEQAAQKEAILAQYSTVCDEEDFNEYPLKYIISSL